MTDLEIVELALRRVAERASSNPFGYWLLELADEIVKIIIELNPEGTKNV